MDVKTLIVAALLALPTQAWAEEACLDGDRRMGPNCVHEEVRPGRTPLSTVYSPATGQAFWDGVGTVVESAPTYIVVLELGVDKTGELRNVPVRHEWTGHGYSR